MADLSTVPTLDPESPMGALWGELESLKGDAEALLHQVSTQTAFDAKTQLVDNVIPLLIALIELQQRVPPHVSEIEAAVDELMDQTEDVLHPETAAQIMRMIPLAADVAKELAAALPKLDEAVRRRCKGKLRALAEACAEASQIITEITVPIEPEPDALEPTNGAANANVAAGELDGGDAGDGAVDGAEA